MHFNKNTFYIAVYVVFGVLLFSSFIYFLNYHYQIITCPYPQDWNEGANILPTYYLLQGKNPFDLANNPQMTNIYGIFYPLLMMPFAKIWGSTLLVHHMVAGFFLFASCVIIAGVLIKNKVPLLLSCVAGMTFYPCLLYPKTTTDLAGPHALGLFLFLMTVFVPYFLNYSKPGLGLSLLLGLLAFYTKIYCVLGVPLVAFYIFLFKSKKTGVLYGSIFLAFFIFSVYLVNGSMNCYFNNVYFVATNWLRDQNTAAHAIAELTRFYQLQKPLLLLMLVSFIIQGRLYLEKHRQPSLKYFFSKINLSDWRGPLLKWDFNIYLYGLIITTCVIYFSMGRNLGQFMEYPFQLMSPFLILYIFNFINHKRLMLLLSLPLILITQFIMASNFPKNFHEFDREWEAIDNLVASNDNIFANPLLIPVLLKYHRPVYDSGHSELFHLGVDRKFLNFELPSHPEIENRNADYWSEIWVLTSQRKFNFLIMYPDNHPFMTSFCALYYRPIGEITLGNFDSTWRYDFLVLVPK